MVASDFSVEVSDFSVAASDFSVMSLDFSAEVSDFSVVALDFSVVASDFSVVASDFSVVALDFSVGVVDFSVVALLFSVLSVSVSDCESCDSLCLLVRDVSRPSDAADVAVSVGASLLSDSCSEFSLASLFVEVFMVDVVEVAVGARLFSVVFVSVGESLRELFSVASVGESLRVLFSVASVELDFGRLFLRRLFSLLDELSTR